MPSSAKATFRQVLCKSTREYRQNLREHLINKGDAFTDHVWNPGHGVILNIVPPDRMNLSQDLHRCHRLIWLNPLSGQDTYEPRVEGMAAALRHVDDFLPVHNLHSLSTFANHLANLS